MREWIDRESLGRAQVHTLLCTALVAIVQDALPSAGSRAAAVSRPGS
jgi:hypothetical protein